MTDRVRLYRRCTGHRYGSPLDSSRGRYKVKCSVRVGDVSIANNQSSVNKNKKSISAKISRVSAVEYPDSCDIASHGSVVLVSGGSLFDERLSSIKVTMLVW